MLMTSAVGASGSDSSAQALATSQCNSTLLMLFTVCVQGRKRVSKMYRHCHACWVARRGLKNFKWPRCCPAILRNCELREERRRKGTALTRHVKNLLTLTLKAATAFRRARGKVPSYQLGYTRYDGRHPQASACPREGGFCTSINFGHGDEPLGTCIRSKYLLCSRPLLIPVMSRKSEKCRVSLITCQG